MSDVTPNAVARLIETGLSPALDADPRLHDLAAELAREVLEYGVSVLPREIFQGRSGSEVAAMVAEDLEAAVWAAPLAAARTVEGAPDAETGEATEVEIRPRVVEFATGWSIVGFLIALLDPEARVELVEPSRERRWWWRRLTSLHGVRNLTVVEAGLDDFAAANPQTLDVAIVTRRTPNDALDFAVPMLRPGGRALVFQRADRSKDVRRPRTNADGLAVRLETMHAFESPVAKGRSVLCVAVETAADHPPLDEQESAA